MASRSVRWLGVGAAVAVSASVLLSAELGSAAPPPKAAKTETRFLSVWHSGDSNVEFGGVGIGQLFCGSSPLEDGAAWFNLPLHLPDGAAALSKVTVYHRDDDATAGHDLTFMVGYHTAGLADVLGGFDEVVSDHTAPPVIIGSTTQQAAVLTPTGGPVPLDRSSRVYHVAARFGACGTFIGSEAEGTLFPSLVLDGALIEYTLR